jgi:hypothetical protein
MDRFIIKVRQLNDDNESSVVGTNSGSSKTAVCQYNKDYFSFGFISSREQQPRPKYLVCCLW